MGCEPEMFVSAAERLLESGFDLIDLNFACPVKKVLGRSRGGFFMKEPDKALKIVESVRKAIPDSVPLTIKLRRGFDDSQQSVADFYKILDGSLDRGIDGITLHGRTVKERYTGLSDWDFIRNVKTHLLTRNRPDVPLLGSGDLFTPEVCVKRIQETGVDGIALARGIIGNPWLFRDFRALWEGRPLPAPPSIAEQREILEEHFRLSEELYGLERASRVMRGFGIKYALIHPQSAPVREAFVREPWKKVLDDWYDS